jgi:transcriptional regulator with XRE-family HTH domain
MIGDHCWVKSDHASGPVTVIETARRAARLSQRRLAEIARTQQSSISEYERRRKSPTLDVVERLLDAADHELAARPRVFWDQVEDPEVGSFWVPDKLWAVPAPKCFAKVQAWKYVFRADATADWTQYIRTWDLSVTSERIDYYQLVVQHGMAKMVEDSVDGVLLMQAWPEMNLPSPIRRAWQPLIDGATKHEGPPLDPGGMSEWMAGEVKLGWPLPKRWRGTVQGS